MYQTSKFNQVWDDVTTIATEEEMRLVCNINGRSIESLESIIYVRTTYRTYDQWVEMEGCKESESNVIAGVDFSDSINKLNQL
mgnify:FL=1|tara:strand:- start:1176 stop:1424 length:249 start_codon:yes stop_codon:yes gene_type:complete